MRITKSKMILVLIVFLITACEELFFSPNPPNTPESNFEIFWNDYNRYYSFFNHKHLNWDSIYQVKRPLINSSTSSKQLFDIMNEMIHYLHDGHADLYSKTFGYSTFDFAKGYPTNKLNLIIAYVNLIRKSKTMSYGIIEPDIGYIEIKSFGGSDSDFKVIDEILIMLNTKKIKGIIIDIRSNGGGSDTYSRFIASRFTDRTRVYSYIRYKNGPGHDEFDDWISKSIKPDGELYLQPVVLLTNRRVFSSAEDFVLAMHSIPTVKIVGDTTGGGSGNPLLRILPNGWNFRVPRWQQVDVNMNYYEGTGIVPDIPVWITPSDLANNKDTILEKAIEELRK